LFELYGDDDFTDETDYDAGINWGSGYSLRVLRCEFEEPQISISKQLERRPIGQEEWITHCVQEDV
jgi:hypothetical protein